MAELRTDLAQLTRALNMAVRQVSAASAASSRPGRHLRPPKVGTPEQEG